MLTLRTRHAVALADILERPRWERTRLAVQPLHAIQINAANSLAQYAIHMSGPPAAVLYMLRSASVAPSPACSLARVTYKCTANLWQIYGCSYGRYGRHADGVDAIPTSILDSLLMIYRLSDSARRLRPATPTKHTGQHKPCDKSADVRHVSHAARVRCPSNGTDAAQKLRDDPELNDYQCGHLNHLVALQCFDLPLWEQQNVRAEHSRDRPRCSQIRHV